MVAGGSMMASAGSAGGAMVAGGMAASGGAMGARIHGGGGGHGDQAIIVEDHGDGAIIIDNHGDGGHVDINLLAANANGFGSEAKAGAINGTSVSLSIEIELRAEILSLREEIAKLRMMCYEQSS